jgi:chromosome partitioning protein
LSNEVSAQLISHFSDKVFRTVIPRNVRLAEAPSFGRPVLYHDRLSRGALAYLARAGEVLRREDERQTIAHTGTRMATFAGTAQDTESVSREPQ